MAYTHSKYEVIVAEDEALTSTGDKADWAPGYVPHHVRAVGVVVTTGFAGSDGVLKVDKRPTAGSDTGRGDGDIAEITLSTSRGQGDVAFADGLDVQLSAGEEAVVEVTDGSLTAGAAHVVLYVEPTWETPANNDNMTDDSA